jgi:hypothetical protein
MKSVYVMQANGLIKIGTSKNPEFRRKQIQATSGLEVALIDSFEGRDELALEVERRVHAILKESRRCGEWFMITPDLAIEAIKSAVKACGANGQYRGGVPISWNELLIQLQGSRSRDEFAEEIGAFGGRARTKSAPPYWTLAGWQRNNNVPPAWWGPLLEIAKSRKLKNINWDLMKALQKKRQLKVGRPKKAL